uniref:Macaca fascicularis brain cDNA clone: QbsB-10411, similar to human hypothetical gene supported by AK126787 (LOC400376), mRNA, RefSeq: XM_375203.1 n=1 Tax=Macaca fascicularis TaxID=9541 RepID=I7GKV1_MACFA|nr:unnamed protein product [Macaca fascicularis]
MQNVHPQNIFRYRRDIHSVQAGGAPRGQCQDAGRQVSLSPAGPITLSESSFARKCIRVPINKTAVCTSARTRCTLVGDQWITSSTYRLRSSGPRWCPAPRPVP